MRAPSSRTFSPDKRIVPDVDRKRHLLRLWLSPDDGRPLPDSFLERYLGTEIGNRGGISVPGMKLNVPLEPV